MYESIFFLSEYTIVLCNFMTTESLMEIWNTLFVSIVSSIADLSCIATVDLSKSKYHHHYMILQSLALFYTSSPEREGGEETKEAAGTAKRDWGGDTCATGIRGW